MFAFYSLTDSDWARLLISGLTIGFFSLSIFYLLLLFFKKIGKRKRASLRMSHWDGIQEALATILIHTLSSEEDDDEYENGLVFLRDCAEKSNLIKQWLLEEIISQKANLSGEASNALFKVYDELGLKSLSLKKLRSFKWHVRARGIIELEQMQQKDCFALFYPFLKSKNSELRRAARLGLTSLAPDPTDFLDHVQEELTEWEQLNISLRLIQRSKESLPDFSKFYDHEQPSVVAFCVSMSVKFGFYDHIPSIIALLKSESQTVQIAVIKGLTEMGAYQAGEDIRTLAMESRSEDIIIECLKYIAVLGSDDHKPVVDHMLSHSSVKIRLQAVNVSIELGFEYDEIDNELKQMYLHHQNELLR